MTTKQRRSFTRDFKAEAVKLVVEHRMTMAKVSRRLCLEALASAAALSGPPVGLLHHCDRGSRYASRAYRDRLTATGAVCSMSGKGDCWDNAFAES